MNRNAKVQRKRVKALTDPQPQFVSLVTAGANMTPFSVVRSDGEDGAATAADVVATAKGDTHEIAQLVFAKSVYDSIDAVKVWLSDGGYEDGTEIVETDDAFIVGEKADDATAVEYEGVTIYLADLPEDAEVAAVESQPTVIEAKDDGEAEAAAEEAPVDAGAEVADAVEFADDTQDAATVVADELVAKSMYAVPELIGLVSSLKWVVSDLSHENTGAEGEEGNYSAVIAALKTSATTMIDGLTTLFAIEVGELAAKFRAEEATEEAEAPAADAADVVEAEAETIEAPAVEETESVEKTEESTEADAEAVQPVANSAEEEAEGTPVEKTEEPQDDLRGLVLSLARSVSELTNNISSLQMQTQTKSEDLVERVEAIESEAQSRKGADVDEVVSSNPTQAQKSGISDLAFNAALGIRRNA